MIDLKEVTTLQHELAVSEDETAYVRLYRIYYTSLFQFATSFLHDKAAAEEIVSDVFMQLWHMREKVGSIQNLTVYLYTCTRNHALNYLRKNKKEVTYTLDDDSLDIPSPTANPEQLFITAELSRKIDAIIEQLPERCRLVFKLVREDGLKYREVAEVMDISIKTVESQMGIAMKRINMAIQPYTGTTLQALLHARYLSNLFLLCFPIAMLS